MAENAQDFMFVLIMKPFAHHYIGDLGALKFIWSSICFLEQCPPLVSNPLFTFHEIIHTLVIYLWRSWRNNGGSFDFTFKEFPAWMGRYRIRDIDLEHCSTCHNKQRYRLACECRGSDKLELWNHEVLHKIGDMQPRSGKTNKSFKLSNGEYLYQYFVKCDFSLMTCFLGTLV